jgi:hypothetical protein
MKKKLNEISASRQALLAGLIIAGLLALLFWRSFLPEYVHFSNDGPLGQSNSAWLRLPSGMFGMWDDLNDVGFPAGSYAPGLDMFFKTIVGPLMDAKFHAPFALLILGVGAWSFFRALKLSFLPALLGALAILLNSTFFASACWGVASQQIALGLVFFALALVVSNSSETPPVTRWARLVLAGLCVGLNVTDAADIGALSSLFVAGFTLVWTLTETSGTSVAKFVCGGLRVIVIALFAGLISAQAIFSLVGTSIQGVAGTSQDTQTKAEHWDFATQWSLPKVETLGLVVPGLFGYKLDTPNGMAPEFKDYYQGGNYWGGMGRDPRNDRYFDNGGRDNPPNPSWMRQTGGGNYCGILVVLVGLWAAAQSFRRENSPFTGSQKKIIWLAFAVVAITLPLAWGRFAPGSHTSDGFLFYALLYKLPYFSTIRNPTKFLCLFDLGLSILFGYGLQALNQQLNSPGIKKIGFNNSFDRRWFYFSISLFAASIIGWLIFYAQQPVFIQYLQKVGFGDENFAQEIASFSLNQAGWFLTLLGAAAALIILTTANFFSGPRATLGAVLFGALLLFDLIRADLPYVIHWDYKYKYEVGSLNPILEFLKDKPYEHRVAGLPFDAQQLRGYDSYFGGRGGVYSIEWAQHHFPYYNIQSLDLIQLPRMPEDMKTYLETFQPDGTAASLPKIARHWELTNTRYLLGAAGFVDVLNQQLDPVKQRFRIAKRFDLLPKPGVPQVRGLEDLTAVPADDGQLAVIEFTGALPRAKLYSNWQVNTNDTENLKKLADVNFDPAQTVLVSTPQINLPAVATNENSGSVEFKSYEPKKLVFSANATSPSVLLLNDKFDPHWRVTVDGKPAELLRCNFYMRGVSVPAGSHTVEFSFSLPNKPLQVTFAGIGLGLLLCGYLLVAGRDTPKKV